MFNLSTIFKKYFFIIFSLSVLSGVVSIGLCKVLPSTFLLGSLFFLTSLYVVLVRSTFSYLSLFFVFGLILASTHASLALNARLPSDFNLNQVDITGFISSVPECSGKKQHFELITQEICLNSQCLSDKFKLKVHVDKEVKLNYGYLIKFTGKLVQPRNLSNPGGFDLEKHYFVNGIHGDVYIGGKVLDKLVIKNIVESDFSRLTILKNNLDDKQGLLSAILLGLRKEVPADTWEVLQRTGTIHLVSVSAFQVAYLFLAISMFILPYLIKNKRGIALKRIGMSLAFLMALYYVVLTGFTIANIRILVMLLVATISYILAIRITWYNKLAFALIVVMICCPLLILTYGFWLSFVAVLILAYTMLGRLNPHTVAFRIWRAQYVLFIGLLPLSLWFFGQTAIIGIIANIIAVPWLGIIIVPLGIVGLLFSVLFFPLGKFILTVAKINLAWLLQILTYLSTYNCTWLNGYPSTLTFILGCIGALLLLAPRGFPLRWGGILGLCTLFIAKHPKEDELLLSILDVGQGLAVVMQTRNHTVIYDTGPAFGEGDAGKRVVIPYLLTQNIKQVNTIIISHSDLDHRGGFNSIMEQYPAQNIITSEPKMLRYSAVLCQAGYSFKLDDTEFTFLNTNFNYDFDDNLDGNEIKHNIKYKGHKKQKRNNLSCVLQVKHGDKQILLTGDIEKEVEFNLVKKAKKHKIELKSDILIVPHHGSKSSSTTSFIAMVRPKYAVFTVGFNNMYGLPKDSVIKKYILNGANILRTDLDGAIIFKIQFNGLIKDPILWKKDSKRYWHME